jgi:hypothetical protein
MIEGQTVACGACGSGRLDTVLDLGRQPVSSHFTTAPRAPVIERELALSVCPGCGVVQLARPFPFRELVPPFDWITYREPEDHLDGVVDRIRALPGVGIQSKVAGLSFKDRSTIERLGRSGMVDARVLDLHRDLGACSPNANIESVAGLFTTDLGRALSAKSGPAHVVIARHVVEHAASCRQFLAALRELTAPDGYLVIEVPDCTANLVRQDYGMIWEEHCYYFTPRTLSRIMTDAGFSLLGVDIHAYPFEDVIVAYARKMGAAVPADAPKDAGAVAREVEAARRYGAAFPDWTDRYGKALGRLTADGRRLAAYGAGHLTCAFLHFHHLSPYFDCVVDDTPEKQGLHLPKSGVPIVSRDRLDADRIAACLFGLGPKTEDKIVAGNEAYARAGGKFYSMLVDSGRSIRSLM